VKICPGRPYPLGATWGRAWREFRPQRGGRPHPLHASAVCRATALGMHPDTSDDNRTGRIFQGGCPYPLAEHSVAVFRLWKPS
jgi:hypothetical protein